MNQNEYGRLRKVLVGREFDFPQSVWDISFKAFFQDHLDDLDLVKKFSKEYTAKIVAERNEDLDNLAKLLTEHGIKVYRPEKIKKAMPIQTPYFKSYCRAAANVRDLCFIYKDTIIEDNNSKVIVTTSGMGTYGPAQVYIPAYIGREGCLIQFTGYTAEGTLGRELKDTLKGGVVTAGGLVKIKYANVEYTNEMSAHAKADEMLAFLKKFNNLKLVLVNHGELESKKILAARITDEVKPKDVAILGRDYLFRISPYGLIRSFTTSYR